MKKTCLILKHNKILSDKESQLITGIVLPDVIEAADFVLLQYTSSHLFHPLHCQQIKLIGDVRSESQDYARQFYTYVHILPSHFIKHT